MISGLITLILYLLIVGILVAVVFYAADNLFPEPIGRFIKIAVVVVAGLIIVLVLLQMVGGGGISLPKLQ